MRSDMLRFIWAVVSHWQVLVTGGVITAIVSVIEHRIGEALSWHAYRWVLVIFVVIAVFLTWREEHGRGNDMASQNADLKAEIGTLSSEIDTLSIRLVERTPVVPAVREPKLSIWYADKPLDGQEIGLTYRQRFAIASPFPFFMVKNDGPVPTAVPFVVRLSFSPPISARGDNENQWRYGEGEGQERQHYVHRASGQFLSPKDVEPLPSFALELANGLAENPMIIHARMRVFYGVERPTEANFRLRLRSAEDDLKR